MSWLLSPSSARKMTPKERRNASMRAPVVGSGPTSAPSTRHPWVGVDSRRSRPSASADPATGRHRASMSIDRRRPTPLRRQCRVAGPDASNGHRVVGRGWPASHHRRIVRPRPGAAGRRWRTLLTNASGRAGRGAARLSTPGVDARIGAPERTAGEHGESIGRPRHDAGLCVPATGEGQWTSCVASTWGRSSSGC